jgi:hypothetical protein
VDDSKQGLMEAVARHENIDNGTGARQVATARCAATGDLAAVRVAMANVTPRLCSQTSTTSSG